MKYNPIRGFMLAFAMLISGLSFAAPASANPTTSDASANGPCSYARPASRAESFFGQCQVINGASLLSVQWDLLKKDKILVISTFQQERLDAEADKYGWRSNKVRKMMDKISHEGNTITVYELTAEGLVRVQNIKGIDISQNLLRVTVWSLADNSNGVPMVDQHFANENWQSIFSKVAASAVGNIVSGVTTSFANAAAQDLFSNCKGSCAKGGGNIFNLSASATGGDGGDAYAEGGDAGAQSSAVADVTNTGGTCPTGTQCNGSGQILNPNPH